MEQHIESRALRQALAARERPSLPSNFAYTTMRRIRMEQQKSERRQRIVAFCCVLAVAILGIGGLVYMFGGVIWLALVNMSKQPDALSLSLPTLFCLTFFALLNRWLARHYTGRDKNPQLKTGV
ncbi:MAG: hypothetical protein J6Y59_06310 [Bacteroidaceae bacterium]|nr:hypothetical protein [Bacteroidaceae bacterium]